MMNVISSTQLLIGSSPEEPSSPNVVPRLPEKRLVEPLLEVHKPLGRLPQRTVINFWLDLSLAIVFVLLTGVITIAQTIFPVGPGSEGWTLWGGDLLAWRGLEFGLLSTLALGIIVHVMLHWDWVCQVSSQLVLKRRLAPDNGLRTIYGVIFLMALLISIGIVLVLAELMIKPPLGVEKVIVPGR